MRHTITAVNNNTARSSASDNPYDKIIDSVEKAGAAPHVTWPLDQTVASIQ